MNHSDLVRIELTADQAIVLSDWLNRVVHLESFRELVDDRAVWSPLLKVSGSLESTLESIFSASYLEDLAQARTRLIGILGEFEKE